MKDTIRLILQLLKIGKAILSEYRRAKDAKRKKAISEAVRSGDLARLRRLILNR